MIPSEVYERTRRFLFGRATVYRRHFDLTNRDAADILRDLAKFCRAHKSTAHTDTHLAARLDGRREVWLRIQNHLQLSDEDLWKLYGEK